MSTASAKTLSSMFAVAALLALCVPSAADIYTLLPDGTGDFTTIQLAVAGTVNGDVIELAPGVYDGIGNRDIDFQGKAVTIQGQSTDPADVVIDCEGTPGDYHRAFYFGSGEGEASIVYRLTIRNGYTAGHGGAVYCQDASPLFDSVVFDSNTSEGSERYGGAVYCTGESSPVFDGCAFIENTAGELSGGRGGAIACRYGADVYLSDCYFEGNVAEYRGGAVYCDGADAVIEVCRVKNNSAEGGAGLYLRYGNHTVFGCVVEHNQTSGNQGGGLLAYYSELTVSQCTFNANQASTGGAMYVDCENFDLTRSIVANSTAGGGVWYAYEPYRDATVSCCNVWNNEGGNYSHIIGDQTGINDNISEDPQFCGEEVGDYRLFDTSPCSEALSLCGQLIGAYDVACDSPVESSSWGRIKATYE